MVRETLPCLDRTNTYGTFLSSQSNGKCRRISKGSASAAITMNSERPRFKVFVAATEVVSQGLEFSQKSVRNITFIGTLSQLLVVGGLLNQVENFDSELSVSQGIGFGVDFSFTFLKTRIRRKRTCHPRGTNDFFENEQN